MNIIRRYPTGSFYICSPAVLDTDEDYICLVHNLSESVEEHRIAGWSEDGAEVYDSTFFISMKKKKQKRAAKTPRVTNHIITENKDFFNKFVMATEIAKMCNIRNKEHRVALFNAIIAGTNNIIPTEM